MDPVWEAAVRRSVIGALVIIVGVTLSAAWRSGVYDPLQVQKARIDQVELVVTDATRSREIPIRVYLPNGKRPAPVALFSHGLGGTRAGSEYLGHHWALRGYVAVFLQHAGSDDAVWSNTPATQRLAAMRAAASLQNLQLRVRDVTAVLDQLEAWNRTADHILNARLNLARIGMSGHSFGAVTTQAVSGQTSAIGKGFTDSRIKAAVIMSPSGPRVGVDPTRAFGQVKIPWMLLTGTLDTSIIGDADLPSRLSVFPALPQGGKYELVLDKAEHSAFTDRALPGDQQRRNPNHHRSILAVTTAFWDAYLRDDPEARIWLDGNDVRNVLEKGDRWQKK